MALKLLQLVPRLPPQMDGIGDHALRLAERLREFHSIETSFLVCDSSWTGPSQIDGFEVDCLEQRDAEDLATKIERCISKVDSDAQAILLQFAPYGYASRGCPAWLIQGMRAFTSRNVTPLITMFHELDAGRGKPWSSTFWLTPVQRLLIRQLGTLSHVRMTNTDYHRRRLSNWHINASLLPSFSTIGEPTSNPPMRGRKNQMVVFGRPWQRKLTYLEGSTKLKYACELIKAERVIDIGDPIPGDDRNQICSIPLVRCGALPSSEVREWMHSSVGSFLFYPDALLTKSSIYAATCAHGTIPFVTSNCEKSLQTTELKKGEDYISLLDPSKIQLSDLQHFSTRLYENYRSRSSVSAAHHVASVMAQLRDKF